MARTSKNGGNQGRGSGLDEEGATLWNEYVKDIVPLEDDLTKRRDDGISATKASSLKKPKRDLVFSPALNITTEQPPQLDGRLEQRLRRGKVAIDATLDLHGLTQASAHTRLNEFILSGHRCGYRCLLVITGKGRGGGEGILRQRFQQWAAMPPLEKIILKIVPAIQAHGGSGAWYVYLKRTRDY